MRNWTEIAQRNDLLQLAAMGSFHVGGDWAELHGFQPREVRFTNGSESERMTLDGQYWVGGMYVQYFFPARQRGACPLLLWHGGGLCGSFFETTPDGRDGWLPYFLRQGWPVFNCDATERGRSGWMPYAELQPSQAVLNARHVAFERFRIGQGLGSFSTDASARKPYPDTQFPMEAYDLFIRQQVPRWMDSDSAAIKAYGQALAEVPPSVIVAHSQGGQFALHAAMNHPDRVRALVLVEPSGTCDPDAGQLLAMAAIPVLVIHGDHIEEDSRWPSIRQRTNALFERLRTANGRVDMLELPHAGHAGNSHLIPIDRNNLIVADLITDWLKDNHLYDIRPESMQNDIP